MAKIERTEQRGIIVAKLLETMRLLIEKIKNSQKKKYSCKICNATMCIPHVLSLTSEQVNPDRFSEHIFTFICFSILLPPLSFSFEAEILWYLKAFTIDISVTFQTL